MSRAKHRRVSGQALVEFALVVPVMLLILLIAIDFGRLFFTYIQVNNAAREAANYAGQHAADSPFDLTAFTNGANAAAAGETNTQGQRGEGALIVGPPFCFDPLAPATEISCSSASNFAPGIGNQVTVDVSEAFSFFTPLVSGFFGGSLTLRASATAPVLNPPAPLATPTPTPIPGRLQITKTLAGDLTGFTGGDFRFDVSCGGRAYGPTTIHVAGGSQSVTIPNIPDGAGCTVVEIDQPQAGPHASWATPLYTPASGQVTIVTNLESSVTITNTRTYNPPGPGPTPTPTPIPTPTPQPTPCVPPTVTIAPSLTTDNKKTLNVRFTGTSTGNPTAWLWDFGDGIQDTSPGPVNHKFTYTLGNGGGPQSWTITLTVTTGTCSGTATPHAIVTLEP